jgi:hypothetical protein
VRGRGIMHGSESVAAGYLTTGWRPHKQEI